MRHINRASATVFVATSLMAATIPSLFAFRIYGHRLAAGARDLVSYLLG